METLSQRGGNALFLHHFAAPWVAPRIKKSTKCITIPYGFMVSVPQSPSKLHVNCHLGRHHDDGATTTAKKEGTFVSTKNPGRGSLFPRLYHPFCMGDGPVSSTSCWPGVLIVSCLCTATIVEMPWLVRVNGILMVVNIAFQRTNRKCLMHTAGLPISKTHTKN